MDYVGHVKDAQGNLQRMITEYRSLSYFTKSQIPIIVGVGKFNKNNIIMSHMHVKRGLKSAYKSNGPLLSPIGRVPTVD